MCGEFLTSALARYYVHEFKGDEPIEMDETAAFIQTVDTSKLKDKTRKFKQWIALKRSIKGILPLKDSKIKKYELFYHRKSDSSNTSNLNRLISIVEETCF